MQIISALLDGKGDSPDEIVKSLGLGKAEDDQCKRLSAKLATICF